MIRRLPTGMISGRRQPGESPYIKSLLRRIREVIAGVLKELEIQTPTNGDKGKIMKVLMPRVKGKADGKLVNETLAEMMKK